jgi:hypothetical protein
MSYQVIQTTNCAKLLDHSDGKFPFIIDRSGVMKTFFNYSATTCCLVAPIVQAAMAGGKADPVEMGELMRKSYVSAAKYGNKVVYRMGGALPTDFAKFFGKGPGKFDPEVVFNPKKFRQRPEFAKVVLKTEDVDRMGNDEIWPLDTMNIILLCDADSELDVEKIISDAIASIPNFTECFDVYVNDN